jgi:hypothetical protein
MGRVRMIPLLLLLALVALTGSADAKRHHRYLPVRCGTVAFHNVIEQTGQQLIAQYNGMGFDIGSPQDIDTGGGSSIDGITPGEACGYVGTRHLKGGVSTGIREGNGFMSDYKSVGEPPFPGETNPAIREYDWKWKELVSNTRKGVLHGTVESINCTKYTYTGGPTNPGNVQGFPC